MLSTSAIADQYDELEVPLLVFHGTADTSTDPAGSEELVEEASSSDKELVLVDDALHFFLDDLDSDRVLQHITSRLDARS